MTFDKDKLFYEEWLYDGNSDQTDFLLKLGKEYTSNKRIKEVLEEVRSKLGKDHTGMRLFQVSVLEKLGLTL